MKEHVENSLENPRELSKLWAKYLEKYGGFGRAWHWSGLYTMITCPDTIHITWC